MDIKEDNGDCSDDDVFFGRLTLKEVKKRIFMDVHHRHVSIAGHDVKDLNSNDLKLIVTSSQPNMHSPSHTDQITVDCLKSTSDPIFNRNKQQLKISPASDHHENEDSFLEIERNVTVQCQFPINSENNYLDNTLEFVDFILAHAQSQVKDKVDEITTQEPVFGDNQICNIDDAPKGETVSQSTNDNKITLPEVQKDIDKLIMNSELPTSPIKSKHTESYSKSNDIKYEVLHEMKTPRANKKEVPELFKTPKIPQSARKNTCSKKTPSRLKAYEHIASPIASYIKNSPLVPLVKDVHPKKPLPNTSLIPKPLKNAAVSKNEKENVELPQLAYRSAKKTLVIDVNKEKLPQSYWAQKLNASQKPVVLKHNHREAGRKPLLSKQDSFQDLSLHQAEVSICTQKLAFNKL